MMKYVRFEGFERNPGTTNRLGIFQLAYELKYRTDTSHIEDVMLRQNLNWLETYLSAPSMMGCKSNQNAKCWFKDAAHEPLKRIWMVKFLLEEYGFYIERVTTTRPGYVIYEDDWQIVAKPFRSVLRA